MIRFVLIALLACAGCTRQVENVARIQYSFWGSVEQMKTERRIVAAFEAAHPHIKVDLLPIGARYSEKIQAMMVGDVAPDVIMVEMTQYFEWASRGVLQDVTDDVRALQTDLTLMPVPARAFRYHDRYFGVPINCSGQAMYVNLDALAAAGVSLPAEGATWEWLEEVAPKFSRRAGNSAAPTDYAVILPPSIILMWAWGAELFDDNSAPTRVAINSAAAADALRYLRRMIARNYAVPPDVVADQGSYQLFRDGKLAFYFDGRWRTPDFAGKTAFAWDVAPMPAGPVRRITQHGGTALGVWSKSKQSAAAREFIRFYGSRVGAEMAMEGGRYTPVFREIAFGEKFLALRPPASIRRFSETMETGASAALLYAPGSGEVATLWASRVEQAVSQKDLPVETVLAGLAGDLERWLAKKRRTRAP